MPDKLHKLTPADEKVVRLWSFKRWIQKKYLHCYEIGLCRTKTEEQRNSELLATNNLNKVSDFQLFFQPKKEDLPPLCRLGQMTNA